MGTRPSEGAFVDGVVFFDFVATSEARMRRAAIMIPLSYCESCELGDVEMASMGASVVRTGGAGGRGEKL
jgi:hypothetical protein